MYCPFCKAKYRAGIARCSDCNFRLVESVPPNEADPNFMVLLWNGESLPFLEAVCAQLDRAELPVATPRVEVLLRDSADRYHLKHLKAFPYVLGVFKRDFVAARKILESVAGNTFAPVVLPPIAAYPEPFDGHGTVALCGKSTASLDATTTICSSDDLRHLEFLEASLDGLDIPFRRIGLESGAYEVQVRPRDESAARQVVEEITGGTSAQAAAAALEDTLLHDEPPKSYFLAWFAPIIYLLVVLAYGAAASGSLNSPEGSTDMFVLYLLGGSASLVGMVWMVYQAIRYEVRPFRYCVAALLPFTFVWYYVERYRARQGSQRLPVAARVRLVRPPSS
jgi:hypothetical protein